MKYFIAVLYLAYIATASADKCTDVYNSCVKATGSDPMSRFKCGMKYLRCRFNDMRSDEEIADELFDGEDKPECKVGFVDCMKAARNAEDKMAASKVCFEKKAACIKDKLQPKIDCVNKCREELKSCRADGSSRMQCGYKFYKCVKPCKDA
uniref:Uncharacterized protein n=1 Tax=Clytia hemisphaerica TaxID=252671 RepID=A0A7M5XFX9_9CNID